MLPNLDYERRLQALERFLREIRGDRGAAVAETWTPTVTQSGAVAVTVDNARYTRIGNLVSTRVSLTVTGAGTGGNVIVIAGQPAAIQPGFITGIATIGKFILLDSGTAYYEGSVYAVGATDWRMFAHNAANAVGVVPNFALAAGDIISLNCVYEV